MSLTIEWSLLTSGFIAHHYAWIKAGVLHRDISDNNIVIHEIERKDENGKVTGVDIVALLIDWDLCKYSDELDKGPTQKNRSVCTMFHLFDYGGSLCLRVHGGIYRRCS